MPSLGDSIFIFMLALMLFGPKKLPQLARQLGKLMAEFRRASNDFRMQMEDELRLDEQKEHQKKVDALAPPPSTGTPSTAGAALPESGVPTEDPPHPHMPPAVQPIAESGELKLMPPSTGLPIESRSKNHVFATEPKAATDLPAADHLIAEPNLAEPTLAGDRLQQDAGMSSEEPSSDLHADLFAPAAKTFEPEEAIFAPAPDRRHPVMVGEGERATHA